MELEGKKVGVFGLGITGRSVVRFLLRHRAYPVAFDETDEPDRIGEIEKFIREMKIEGKVGAYDEGVFRDCSLVVVSPGIDLNHPIIQSLVERGVEVIGDIELGYRFTKAKVIAITGSNGKSTTCALTAHLINQFREAYAVGNIGKPFCDIADKARPNEIICLEVSSFQLESCVEFAPDIATITNITPDHLDRHESFERYAETKRSVVKNMGEGDSVIYNAEDENLQPELFPRVAVMFFPFSSAGEVGPPGAWLEEDKLVVEVDESPVRISLEALRLPGLHNVENALASLMAARLVGAKKVNLEAGLKTFTGYEHRLELVREVEGVKYVNDSKATNPEASLVGIKSFSERVVLIAGGRDKGTSLQSWVLAVRQRCKAVILIGEAKGRFERELKSAGFEKVFSADDLEQAVICAKDIAQAGDVVLLSPACASFDMFSSFEERGNKFKELVEKL